MVKHEFRRDCVKFFIFKIERMCISVKDEKQNEFKKPTPKEFSEMLKDIGFVKSTHEYKNFYIERDLVKHKQFDEELDVNNEDKNISN
ncbi:hypothetical protein [Paraclostridium sordellii]|uniref:hypothetical protein n=1 Tax=Paraclostridium sordellii TaxID=1505 RepID=UPI0005E12E71|nr:hypothetical protein [Paeniclostridium sordellii]CEN77852.1 Uncharacterised protein [[Clostridium] sordellii] [Paeniclostridium sordellii]